MVILEMIRLRAWQGGYDGVVPTFLCFSLLKLVSNSPPMFAIGPRLHILLMVPFLSNRIQTMVYHDSRTMNQKISALSVAGSKAFPSKKSVKRA